MLTGGPALARCCRLEITSAETQRRPEEIRAQLLEPQSVGIKAFRAAADQVLFGHLPRPYAPNRSADRTRRTSS